MSICGYDLIILVIKHDFNRYAGFHKIMSNMCTELWTKLLSYMPVNSSQVFVIGIVVLLNRTYFKI